MDDKELQDEMMETLIDYFEDSLGHCDTFENCGVLTRDKGLVLGFDDGSEFQVTIVQLRRSKNED